MSDGAEKTEAATPRRRGKERERGNISKSPDLSAALVLIAGLAILTMLSGYIINNLEVLLHQTFTHIKPSEINPDNISSILAPFVTTTSRILMPFLIVLFIVAFVAVRAQVGHVLAFDKIKFKFDNIAPSKLLNNAKSLFNPVSPKNLVELTKSLIKLLVVFSCGYSVINGRKNELYALLGLNVSTAFGVFSSILTQMLINMCLAMLVIGFLDKKYQDYEYEKAIKMTKQEIKDELKDTEGDPKIKSKIRSIQMKMAKQKMMSSIKDATVVVTNPTHYAVALEYDRLKAPAPKVLAKGVDFIAFKIREVAQNNNVPIVENPPLARALYKLVPIDGIIPSDMFVAVAEVLAYVYNNDNKK